MAAPNLISFQEIWSVAVGMSSIQDAKLVEQDLFKSIETLKLGLDFFKPYSSSSFKEMNEKRKMSENLKKFVNRAAKLLNVHCCQMHDMVRQFAKLQFRGSKQKLQQLLADEKNSHDLLSNVAEFYFTERLYCVRCVTPMIAYFQDNDHPFKDVYSEILSNLPDLVTTLTNQFEKLFSCESLNITTRGVDCTSEVLSKLAIQQIKEQCEILQVFLLYYSHFEMLCDLVAKLAKIFKEHSFGISHPLLEVADSWLVKVMLTSMSWLMQVLLIEGFDLEFLQDPDAVTDHQLKKHDKSFKQIDDIILKSIDESSLSPLMLAWATVRYVLMEENGGLLTQKLGERAIDNNVWREIDQIIINYPFNTESNISSTAKRVLRGVISCVTKSFHEDTLGCYGDLVAVAVRLLEAKPTDLGKGIARCDMDALLLSASGYFPINSGYMLELLAAMATSEIAAIQIHAFLSDLPTFAEYLATCPRDDVESLQDGSCWRLLCHKPISVAGGMLTVKLRVGTLGQLVDSQQGELVQWQQSIDGWKVFDAEIQSLLKYQGPSSNYHLLGFIEKSQLIFRLVEKMLASLQSSSVSGTDCMAVLETMNMFISKIPGLIQKIMQMTEPATQLISTCLQCYIALVKMNPSENAQKILSDLKQVQYFPSMDKGAFQQNADQVQIYPGIFGRLLTEWERVNNTYLVTMATVDLMTSLLEHSMESEDKITECIAVTVNFVMKEVFCCLLKWQRNEDLWDNIGVRCLKLFHVILRIPDSELTQSARILQKSVVASLLEQNGAEVLLKIASVPVDLIQSVFLNQPFSSGANQMSEIVRLAFSVLNNLLRSSDLVADSNPTFLKQVLATPNVGESSVVSNIAGYIYHRYTLALPQLSLAILRQVSLIAPMSLHANLGDDVVAFRDILLSRLRSRIEHHSLKIAILDFMVVSVQTQPGLLELFLDLEPKVKDKPEEGLQLGKSSFLHVVLSMIEPDKQGTYRLPTSLHTACVKFLNALWVDKRHPVLEALKCSGKQFWSSLLLPLFSENSPKEIAQNELLETCAHSLNVVALETFYMSHGKSDKNFQDLMKEFKEKKRYQHWSKVLLCVSKSLAIVDTNERERHLMFTSALQTFISAAKLTDEDLVKSMLDDVISSILFLVGDTASSSCKEVNVLLNLCTELLLTQVYNQIKKKRCLQQTNVWLERSVQALQKFEESGNFSKSAFHLHTTAYHLAKAAKNKDKNVLTDLIQVTCHDLSTILKHLDTKPSAFIIEASIVLIQTLELLCESDDGEINQSWRESVSRDSTIFLLMMVLVDLTETCKEQTEKSAPLCIAILRLFSHISSYHEVALTILHTRNLPKLCLNWSNAYNAKSKKWLNVYHASLHFMTCMIGSVTHDFTDNTLDFIGVHQERIIQCLSALPVNQGIPLLREVDFTTALLAGASGQYLSQWKFKLLKLYDVIRDLIAVTCQTAIALLLHPRLVQETMKLRERKHQRQGSLNTSLSNVTPLRTRSSSSKLLGHRDDDSPSREITPIQIHLTSILGNCLTFLKNLSPGICEVMLDYSFVADEYPRLLAINFGTPTMEPNVPVSFGGIISAANFALSALHKANAINASHTSYKDSLTYIADVSLVLVMSQCLLLLKQTNVSHRNKQFLRRNLGDELSSCVRSASRHLRHSSSSYSPQSSPSGSQPVQTGFAKHDGKNILGLVSEYVKQVLR
uniref:Nucleoporin NUP188 homolog n=1 Tax=Phallusia mammillata TaxID=59560 RepID=A0A6F9DM46_9ASCI|nr:nucleoporin NUP188 homolog [Phallusia mammillata]